MLKYTVKCTLKFATDGLLRSDAVIGSAVYVSSVIKAVAAQCRSIVRFFLVVFLHNNVDTPISRN